MKIKKYISSKLAQFKQWILFIVKCRFFLWKKTFVLTPFIYLDKNGDVLKNGIGDSIKWLGSGYVIKEYCLDKAMKIARDKVSKLYQGNLDYVWYF